MASTNHLDASQIFSLAIQESFKHWPILRIAKQQGFGGRYANEKEEWLRDSVIQIFHDNDNVHPDDIQDFISEALFNEFDTIVEDGSLPEICLRICQFYQMCKENNGDQVLVSLNKIAAASAATSNISVRKVENLSDEEDEKIEPCASSQNGFVGREENHLIAQFTNQSNDTSMETDEKPTDEDGWEVVRRSKKK